MLSGGIYRPLADLHVPVMVGEVLEFLLHDSAGVYCDATTGTGGHSKEILERLASPGRLICLDQDPVALDVARERLENTGDQVRFHRGSFSRLDLVLRSEGLDGFDGILADLGLNSYTLDRPDAGMSYQQDVPLDMAVDPDVPRNAAELVQSASQSELAELLREFGDLRRAELYARRIVDARRGGLETTGDLVRALRRVDERRIDRNVDAGELSRIFQALRVVVLEEMPRLDALLAHAHEWLRPGGRLVVLSYAGHEDRKLKVWSKENTGSEGDFIALQKKPLAPGREEVGRNRRARSAKLRAFEKKGESGE